MRFSELTPVAQAKARAAYVAAMADPTLPNAAKHNLEATYHVTYGRAYFKCRGCMMAPALCVCSALARVTPGAAGSVPPHRLAVLMHHKEYGRASNTGCLLAPSVGATTHISGIAADEAALAAALDSAGTHGAAVLWPGEGSISLDELRASTPPQRWADGMLLIAIDATWGSARKLVKRVPPGVPRLALPAAAFAPGRSLLFPVRKYEGPCAERYCTFEACIALLDALGALEPGQRELLTRNLKIKVDALLKHKNRRAVYGNETAEALAAAHAALLDELRQD